MPAVRIDRDGGEVGGERPDLRVRPAGAARQLDFDVVAGRVDFLDGCQTTGGGPCWRQFKNHLSRKGRNQINAIEHIRLKRAGRHGGIVDIAAGPRHPVILTNPPCRAVGNQRDRIVLLEQDKIAAVGAVAVLFLDRDRVIPQIVFLERDPAPARVVGVGQDHVIGEIEGTQQIEGMLEVYIYVAFVIDGRVDKGGGPGHAFDMNVRNESILKVILFRKARVERLVFALQGRIPDRRAARRGKQADDCVIKRAVINADPRSKAEAFRVKIDNDVMPRGEAKAKTGFGIGVDVRLAVDERVIVLTARYEESRAAHGR